MTPLDIPLEIRNRISEEFTLVFTGLTRSASAVLGEDPEDEEDKISRLREIRGHANVARGMLESGDLSGLGGLLKTTWELKRGISASVSRDDIDEIYNQIMGKGATGAKLLGAGGGGFFLVHGNAEIRESLGELGLLMIPLGIDEHGSTIIHRG